MSKKYKQLAAKAKEEQDQQDAQTDSGVVVETDTQKLAAGSVQLPILQDESIEGVPDAGSDAGAELGASDDSDGSQVADVQSDDEPWVPRLTECLFDSHESASFQANLRYMETAHSFFVPDAECLVDAEGLFALFQEKICRYHTCLYCNKGFGSLEACRGHMKDKSHCKVNFESGAIALELSEFYSPSTSLVKMEGGVVRNGVSFEGDGDSSRLVLPNGSRAGNRSLQKFYKQKLRKIDTRVSVSMGKSSRLQNLEMKMAMRAEKMKGNIVLLNAAAFAKGNSKAISSTFTIKADFADNKAARAIVHHWGGGGGGSHYHMSGSKQFLKGVRVKGVISRHSKQGAKMQAARKNARFNRGHSGQAVLR